MNKLIVLYNDGDAVTYDDFTDYLEMTVTSTENDLHKHHSFIEYKEGAVKVLDMGQVHRDVAEYQQSESGEYSTHWGL